MLKLIFEIYSLLGCNGVNVFIILFYTAVYLSESSGFLYFYFSHKVCLSHCLCKQTIGTRGISYIKPWIDGSYVLWQFTYVTRASNPYFIRLTTLSPTSPPSENIRIARPRSSNCRYGVSKLLNVTFLLRPIKGWVKFEDFLLPPSVGFWSIVIFSRFVLRYIF